MKVTCSGEGLLEKGTFLGMIKQMGFQKNTGNWVKTCVLWSKDIEKYRNKGKECSERTEECRREQRQIYNMENGTKISDQNLELFLASHHPLHYEEGLDI